MNNFAKHFVTLVGAMVTSISSLNMLDAIDVWLSQGALYVANDGNQMLFTNVLGVSFGIVFAILPWINLPDTSWLARLMVFIPSVATALVGLFLVTRVLNRALDPSFVTLEGWNVLLMVTLATVAGILGVYASLFTGDQAQAE